MYQASHHAMDSRLEHAMNQAGMVGGEMRSALTHDLKAKLILRSGRDPLEIVGLPGTGKHLVATAAHQAAHTMLGRSERLIHFDCEEGAGRISALTEAFAEAAGGTLVLSQFNVLPESRQRKVIEHAERSTHDTLLITLSHDVTQIENDRDRGNVIHVKPLHEREDDIWALIDHFFEAAVEDLPQTDSAPASNGCKGFSRQAKADISEVIKTTGLSSVRQLRTIVRDLSFEALARTAPPLKLTSDDVRPYLETHYQQTETDREEHDAALVASQFDALIDRTLLEQLAETHGVPVEVMQRQAQLTRELIGYIDDIPRSYRNILTRLEDIQRAGLWLVSGARTQAEFRRYFGEERYMRPTKSVAWAFYNRVFKREM